MLARKVQSVQKDPVYPGYPSAYTTGPSAGPSMQRVPQDVSSGTGWSWDSRGWVSVYGTGAVFERYIVSGAHVELTGDNTIVRDCIIEKSIEQSTANGTQCWLIAVRHAQNVTITRNILRGLGNTEQTVADNCVRGVYGDEDGYTITYNRMYKTSSGINAFCNGGLIEHNYIYDFGYPLSNGDLTDPNFGHFNGIQDRGGGNRNLLVINNNTIMLQYGFTDAIMLAVDSGQQHNRRITNNLMSGGSYTLYARGRGDIPSTDIVITGNTFSTKYFANSGLYGSNVYFEAGGSGNVWSGNTWYDGPNAGQTVPYA